MTDLVRSIPSRDGRRLRIVLDHPKGNIITAALAAEARAALGELSDHRSLRLVTLEGAGSDFSFGASIQEHAPGYVERMLPEMHRLIRDLLDVAPPTAAIVTGRCLGGGFELALACDFIFAAETAVLGVPEVMLAAFPPAAAALLPLRVGYARATEAVLTGAARPAGEWHAAGLVTLVAPEADLASAVDAWFETNLASRSAVGLRHAVAAARLGLRAHVRQVLPDLERIYLNQLMRTADVAEAVSAFLEKRQPSWSD